MRGRARPANAGEGSIGDDHAFCFEDAMNARLAFLAIASVAAGGMYAATFPPEWPWHSIVAAAGIAGVTCLGLGAIFGRRKKAKPK